MNQQPQHRPGYDYLENSYQPHGVGGWRRLYTQFINKLEPGAICELGAGSPDFLLQFTNWNRTAIDLGEKFKPVFEQYGIGFIQRDLNHDSIEETTRYNVVVCSDVFEHLTTPLNALQNIKTILKPDGLLFSHVPNEFRLTKTVKVMLGTSNSLYFHKDHEEWSDPHVRRFTDKGYKRFLENCFTYNIKINDMYDPPWTKMMRLCLRWVPYAIEWGPTYVSTNSKETFDRITSIRKTL